MLKPKRIAFAIALIAVSPAAFSASTPFSTFTPAASSVAGGSLPESAPLKLSSPYFTHTSILDRNARIAAGTPDTGAWDMITSNESGPDRGRYLFMPMETGSAGVIRYDRLTGTSVNIVNPGAVPSGAVGAPLGFAVGDASRWTPWGSYLTAEETWTAGTGTRGRLMEVTNPTTAGAGGANFVHRSIIPRVSHEGLAFDKNNNMYFIDELNGGSIYKFTSANPTATNGNDYFAAGTTSVLRVGTGFTANATGAASWVNFTDGAGNVLAGGVVTDGSVDGRATTDVAAYKGTDYQRPEDLEIQTLAGGKQLLYFTTTTTNEVYSIDLDTNTVSIFANRNTINAASGLAVGSQFTSPDNLAIDAAGNIYIIEDQPGGAADIWFATDANRDGVAESIGRWASLSTLGAEPTGLYFDPFDPTVAFVNVQHPSSGNDRLLMITAVPEPETYAMMIAGLGLLGAVARRRRRTD